MRRSEASDAKDENSTEEERWRAEVREWQNRGTDQSRDFAATERRATTSIGREFRDPSRSEITDGESDHPESSWPATEIREADWNTLRLIPKDGSRFSEPRLMWVRVDDPRLESTDEVRGETFKGGEPTEEYKVDLERLWRERDLVKSVDQVDHRHVGGYRIRIEEDPAGQLTIVNGRHRVQAAREAGVPAVLAEAVAYIDESEDATEDQKIVDNSDSGRVDVYENGLGQRADSTRHDHYFATFRADGVVYESGLVDREEERAEYLRWLGMIGTRGLT